MKTSTESRSCRMQGRMGWMPMFFVFENNSGSGKVKDWDSREELAACMLDWDYPDLQPRIDRAVMQLRQNSGMA